MSTSKAPNYLLYEHAIGYTLLKIKEHEDSGQIVTEVQHAMTDAKRSQSIVQVHAFEPFKNTEAALENANSVSEGLVHPDLLNFLEANLPKKKKKVLLGVGDKSLAGSIVESIPGIRATFTGVVQEILRGVRTHFHVLAKELPHASLHKAQLSLGHSYSRSKIQIDIHRVDNMVIQSIALLDKLDRDIILFGKRFKKWYNNHLSELICTTAIMNRENMSERVEQRKIQEILEDEQKSAEVIEAARTSMGMEISKLDLQNIDLFAKRVAALAEYRQRLHQYIKDRLDHCAPTLEALLGEHIVQSFLQKDHDARADSKEIVRPRKRKFKEPTHMNCFNKTGLTDSALPQNIKDFDSLRLSYLDMSVLKFMQRLRYNALLSNVNLWFTSSKLSKDTPMEALAHILPLINNINSIQSWDIYKFSQILNAGNHNEYSQTAKTMLVRTRILETSYNSQCLLPNEFVWFWRWLYNARTDGKPRVLIFSRIYNFNREDSQSTISDFVDRIKEDFLKAEWPVSFIIRISVPFYSYQFQKMQNIGNEQTNERLVVKNVESDKMLIISRHPMEETKECIEENGKECSDWDFWKQSRKIILDDCLRMAM